MGLQIKKHKTTGKLKLTSSISSERLHDAHWISLEEAKKILIDRAFSKFLQNVCEIGIDFPAQYYINDERQCYPEGHESFNSWWLAQGCETVPLYIKANEIVKKLDIEYLKPLLEGYGNKK